MRLRGYQQTARDFLRARPGAGLFLTMGLGKTASALMALTPEHLPALVIAPPRVARGTWPDEAGKWRPDLGVAVAAGTPAQRHKALMSGMDIVAIGNNVLTPTSASAGMTPEALSQFKTIIFDELHSFKNPGSKRFKHLRSVTRKLDEYPVVWGLTGTPTPGTFVDLWSQVFLLDQGERLGTSVSKYRDRYFTPRRALPNGAIPGWNPRPGAQTAIMRKIEDICLALDGRVLVEQPEIFHNTVYVELPPAPRRAYQQMRNKMLLQTEQGPITAKTAASMIAKLQQAACGFMYGDAEHNTPDIDLHYEKTNALREIVDSAQGSPVLVFYRFTRERDRILAAFPGAETIDAPDVIDRWNKGQVPMLLAHPASAGYGLNLQHGGHTIVWTTPSWSAAETDQSNARLARSGQPYPVVAHYLIAAGTIEEDILERAAQKARLEQALFDHLKEKP